MHDTTHASLTRLKTLDDACGTAQIALELQTGQAPAVFTPVGNDIYMTLIMPMTVR